MGNSSTHTDMHVFRGLGRQLICRFLSQFIDQSGSIRRQPQFPWGTRRRYSTCLFYLTDSLKEKMVNSKMLQNIRKRQQILTLEKPETQSVWHLFLVNVTQIMSGLHGSLLHMSIHKVRHTPIPINTLTVYDMQTKATSEPQPTVCSPPFLEI